MKFLTAIFVTALVVVTLHSVTTATAEPQYPSATYQGKSVNWWAKRAVQARKDANARGRTIRRLKASMAYHTTIQECVKLATIAYPALSEERAWYIIKHESWMTPNPARAKNPTSTASGLWQFLTSTFASTPYGKAGMSIWSPCASSLAAGWMHEVGRGGEWFYG